MELRKHERFIAANQQLRKFLQQAEGLANGSAAVTEGEVKTILVHLLNFAPAVGDASRSETLDARLREEMAEYIKNLRALQQAVERICRVMLCRRAQLEATKRNLDGLQGWIHAFQ